MRYIEVEKCSITTCPYCIPDSYSKSKNWCHGYEEPYPISANIKTFPSVCVLPKEAKE